MKRALLLLILFVSGLCSFSLAYTPPAGVPNPSIHFGWEIDRATPAWPAEWTATPPTAVPGFFYVDKTSPAATDSSNPHGHPGKPRKTPPFMGGLAAGTFIYIHAGTYGYSDLGSSAIQFSGNGTSASPIWLTGNPENRPVFNAGIQCGHSSSASFCIIENLIFAYGGIVNGSKRYGFVDVRPAQQNVRADHILIRRCDFSGEVDYYSQGGINFGGSQVRSGAVSQITDAGGGKISVTVSNTTLFRPGEDCSLKNMSVAAYNGTWKIDAVPDNTRLVLVKPFAGNATGDAWADFTVEFCVAYNNTAHDHGNPPQDDSEHYYVYQSQRSRYVWVLDSTAYGIGADCVAGGHNANDTDAKAHHLYIGRNYFADPAPRLIQITGAADAGNGKTRFTVASTAGIPAGPRATAEAVISGGQITGINVTNGGANYFHCGVRIEGNGSGAWALGVCRNGEVSTINLGSRGTGYTTAKVTLLGRACFISEGPYKGMWEVEEVPDSTHVVLRVPFAGDATGTLDLSKHSGENAIDLKSIRYVVISENFMQGPYLREQGWAVVLHSGSNPVPVRDCWSLFNRVTRCTSAFVVTSTNGGHSCSFVGNVINNCYDKYCVPDFQGDSWNGAAIRHMVCQGTNYIVDNTLSDYEEGIICGALTAGDKATIHGNIMFGRNRPDGYDILVEDQTQKNYVDADYNFYPANPRIWWGNTGIRTSVSAFRSAFGEEVHGLSGDPLFTNTSTSNFSLQQNSPAKDSSIQNSAAYSAFEAVFGIPVSVDALGGSRPVGDWDRGAFEYGATPTHPPLPPGEKFSRPGRLRIVPPPAGQ